MEVAILADEAAIADAVADVVIHCVSTSTFPVVGLATGSSPLPTYRRLIERYRAGDVSFAETSVVTLDEYVGLPSNHLQAYRTVIRREFADQVDLPADRLFTPDATSADLAAECRRYDRLVVDLGVDVQLLGIGGDGHLAFNEPGSSLGSRTRPKTLTDQTRRDNARFFDSIDEVPRHVVTQGLGTIRDADHLVLIATGEAKAEAVAAAVEGPITAMCPASVLQLHPHVTVFVDEPAATGLRLTAYYRETLHHKPRWQHH